MISMAFLGDLTYFNFPESEYRLIRLSCRFRKVTFPGDVLTCEGKIKTVLPDGGWVLTLSTKNESGELKTDGEAEVRPICPP